MPKREFIIQLVSLSQENKISFLGYRRNQWVNVTNVKGLIISIINRRNTWDFTEYPDACKFHGIRGAKTVLRQIEASGLDCFSGLQKVVIIENYGYENETVVGQIG